MVFYVTTRPRDVYKFTLMRATNPSLTNSRHQISLLLFISSLKMSNHGFQPENSGFNNNGNQPQDITQTGFVPTPSNAFPLTQKGSINTDVIMAFTKEAAEGVPVGYQIGYDQGVAKASGPQKPVLSQLGFIDTTESNAYGQGYQYGWSQGFSNGYAQGLTKNPTGGFAQGGFN